jgi:hypothetical protein
VLCLRCCAADLIYLFVAAVLSLFAFQLCTYIHLPSLYHTSALWSLACCYFYKFINTPTLLSRRVSAELVDEEVCTSFITIKSVIMNYYYFYFHFYYAQINIYNCRGSTILRGGQIKQLRVELYKYICYMLQKNELNYTDTDFQSWFKKY